MSLHFAKFYVLFFYVLDRLVMFTDLGEVVLHRRLPRGPSSTPLSAHWSYMP